MSPAKQPAPQPVVRVAPLGELNAYTVYEHELDLLAQGSPAGIFLNFALALLPLAAGILATMLSSTMSDLKYAIFTSAVIICLIAGLICLALWWHMHKSVRSMVEDIKRRMPGKGTPTVAAAPPPPTP